MKSEVFLVLSGLATGASWLYHYKALHLGIFPKIASIDRLSIVITLVLTFVLLREEVTAKVLNDCIPIGAETLFMML